MLLLHCLSLLPHTPKLNSLCRKRAISVIKVLPVLYWAPHHEGVLGEWRYSSTHSLTSEPHGGEWSASRPGHFTPKERAIGTHLIGDWVGPRAVLDAVVKRKIPSPHRESNPRTLIVQSVAQRYTDWAIMALISVIKEAETYFQKLGTVRH
jgi:hypothetical protein